MNTILCLSGPSLPDAFARAWAQCEHLKRTEGGKRPRVAAVNAAGKWCFQHKHTPDLYGSFEPESAPKFLHTIGATIRSLRPASLIYTSRACTNRAKEERNAPDWAIPYQPNDYTEPRVGPPEWGGQWRGDGITSGLYMAALLCELHKPQRLFICGMDGYKSDAMYAEGIPVLALPKGDDWIATNNRLMAHRMGEITRHYSDTEFWLCAPTHLDTEGWRIRFLTEAAANA